jgi:hypothetical protein
MMAKNKPMGVKKTAKAAKEKAMDVRSKDLDFDYKKVPSQQTKRLVRQNVKGKVSLGDRILGIATQSKTEKKASTIMQNRRENERNRTAARAKGIAARQKKVAQARRRAKSLGN